MHDNKEPKRLTVEGQPSKPWVLWRVSSIDGRQIERVAKGDTREELSKAKRRLDWSYKIYHKGKPVD
jgi:hypothetical protein